MKYLLAIAIFVSIPSHAGLLIAHRGLYQNYGHDDLDLSTCTASKIKAPIHAYLENTLASIQAAFDLGANMVELDIHPTSESDSNLERLAVFHDWNLSCRTNGTGDTDQQSWDYLKNLDIGYGYTYDGTNFPFRGKGYRMPAFSQAVELLARNPAKMLLVNVKDKYERTQKLLLKELALFPLSIRQRVWVEYQNKFSAEFERLSVPEAIWQPTGAKQCLLDLISRADEDFFPTSCHNKRFFIPLHLNMGLHDPKLDGVEYSSLLKGWPEKLLQLARENGSEIYLMQVNAPEDFVFAKAHEFSGYMTDRIDQKFW